MILRSAYDPVVAGALERHGDLGRDLVTAGPVAVSESWSSVRSDSAHHCVLWISEWPRSLVYPGFLAPVLLSSGVRRTFSLLFTPMRTDQAARDIRKKKTEYISDAAQRQRIGQIEDAQQSAEYNDVLQQETDLTAGHGILRTTGLVAVSAQDPDELERAVADIEQAAIQASGKTRRLWGQQDRAFKCKVRAAALSGRVTIRRFCRFPLSGRVTIRRFLSVPLPTLCSVAGIRRIDNEQSAAALADLLNGNTHRRPVVVVTIPAGRDDPWIDVEEIARESGNLADVYLMPTGSFTWEFSRRMAEGTQVYGGAGRVYPVGHEWASDLTQSPLRFAFNANDGDHATQQLISDTLRMAAAAGLLQTLPTRELRKLRGAVKMTVAGRALVDVGNLFPAAIAEELTVEDVPIDRIVTAGQHIEGWYDAETNRFDITKSLRSGSDALASYSVGDVVLTKVAMVRNGKAELVLYPKTSAPAVTVGVLRDDVTTNPFDDLRTLMTVGEVIPARVVATGPQWTLVLNDADEDEPIVEPPSLLAGGPPWLVQEPDEAGVDEPQSLAPPTLPMPTAAPEPGVEEPEVRVAPAPIPTPTRPSPTPAMLDRNRPRPVPSPPAGPAPSPQPAESTRALLLKIDGLTAEVSALKRDQDNFRMQLLAGADEREQLRYLLDQAERRANRAENDLKAARSRLRKAGYAKPSPATSDGPQFADAEQRFRYLVLTQWATRTLPSEQAERPLPEYVIGPRFLDSLDKLEGIKAEKVADVVFEIVTGLAPQIPSREVHHFRIGPGGDDPVRIREDGAVAWRASLQVKTPSARRIHYWILPSGQIELARVATHEDFNA